MNIPSSAFKFRLRWTLACTLFAAAFACAPTSPPPEPKVGPPPRLATQPALPDKVETIAITPRKVDASVRSRIEQTIEHVRHRDLLSSNSFWTVFHGILGLGPSAIIRDEQSGLRLPALDYVCNGGKLRGLHFIPTAHGLDVFMGEIGVAQGHQDQFIAEMAQWGMPAERPFIIQDRRYTFQDFINHCQKRARITTDQELSWAVIIIAQYFGADAKWINEHGESLCLEDLIRYELNAPIETAACGGTHRLFGLTWAHHLHLKSGGRSEGVWAQVAEKTAQYRDRAKNLRNSDGSLSTGFFAQPGQAPDRTLRINTTGHQFEWLALALSDQELAERWMEEAANALCLMILEASDEAIDSGSLYHAMHGLIIYYARRFDRNWLGPRDPLIPLPSIK